VGRTGCGEDGEGEKGLDVMCDIPPLILMFVVVIVVVARASRSRESSLDNM
jgi:hypothetical protein